MPQPSKREAIERAGLGLVHARGYGATGVAAIAAAGGAPKGSFYNHYASKDDFAVALLDRYLLRIREALAATVGAAPDPVSGIRAYFELLRRTGAADGFAAGCLVGNLCAEAAPASPVLRERLVELLAAWRAPIGDAILRARAGGELRADGPAADLVAALLIDAFQGALLRAKAERSSAALDAFLELTLPALLGAPR